MYSGAFSLFHNVPQLQGRCVRIPPYQNNKENFLKTMFFQKGVKDRFGVCWVEHHSRAYLIFIYFSLEAP